MSGPATSAPPCLGGFSLLGRRGALVAVLGVVGRLVRAEGIGPFLLRREVFAAFLPSCSRYACSSFLAPS